MVTDTIALRSAVSGLVQQLSCAELLARSIAQIEVGGSVSAVFDGSNHIF
jgi:phosphoribosylpyrophosphate synthetase